MVWRQLDEHTHKWCLRNLFVEMNWDKSKKTENGKKKYKIIKGFAFAYKVVVYWKHLRMLKINV